MKLRKKIYVVHRWIGLMVSLQLLAWSLGGFVFSISHIDSVRGEREIGSSTFDAIDTSVVDVLPESVRSVVRKRIASGESIGSVALLNRGLGARWEVRDTDGLFVASAATSGDGHGSLLLPQEAEHLALRDFAPDAAGASVRLIEAEPPVEYRKGPLPAYQVMLDHPKRAHIYVDARTGEITARRNRQWRIFDFFWMLHTMDYNGRDDFNHLLLTIFSLLAVATATSGLTLWGWRTGTRFGRWKRSRAGARRES